MILHDLIIYGSPGKKDIFILDGKIKKISGAGGRLIREKNEVVYNLNGAVAFPGFINSHDHLDFNNYPQLGRGGYKNYTEWGHDIHERFFHEIEAVKKIPQALRIRWGLYKNLLNGFTSVVNHGDRLAVDNELVSVFRDCYSLHSVSFEKKWWWKLNHPLRNSRPYVMHLGEGVDEKSSGEIKKVIRSNWLGKKIIAVHGVALTERLAGSFAALIWCPASNFFLLGQTAAIDKLKQRTKVLFGTDATLTSPWRTKEHFWVALETGLVTKNELADMLTITPAHTWKLDDRGTIAENKVADIVITSSDNPAEAEILLVIKGGEVMLADELVQADNGFLPEENYSRIRLGKQILYVKGNLSALVAEILRYYPSAEIPFEVL
ncbi:MAG: amidohydrolase family protein [Sphingobacteriales bacterium]|nr:amidohydrolase family protein [Sphingobacteriales bacterium]